MNLSPAARSIRLVFAGGRGSERSGGEGFACSRRGATCRAPSARASSRRSAGARGGTARAARLSFHARVAANVLAQIERELHSGLPDTTGDAELCTAIRAGTADFTQAYDTIRETVVEKLRISNPRHLLPED